MRRPSALVWFAAVGVVACAGVLAARHASRTLPSRAPAAQVRPDAATALRHLPLTFERNDGQFAPHVRFAAVHSAGRLAIADDGYTVETEPGRSIRVRFIGAEPGRAVGQHEQAGRSNYFVGRDRSQWRTNIPTYSRVHRAGVYPGIDAIYYGADRQLEYDFVVAPGANPRVLRLRAEGATTALDRSTGDLVLRQDGREVRQHAPLAYELGDGHRRAVDARYTLESNGDVRVVLGDYDATRTLVIDPVISFSTYLRADHMGVDTAGNLYLIAFSIGRVPGPAPTDLSPATTAYGSDQRGFYAAKLDASGRLVFSTFLSGTGEPRIAVGADDRIYVSFFDGGLAPVTVSSDSSNTSFVGALSSTTGLLEWGIDLGFYLHAHLLAARPGGGVAIAGKVLFYDYYEAQLPIATTYREANRSRDVGGRTDYWVVTLSDNALPEGATYFGGTRAEEPRGLAVGPDGSVYVGGSTTSPDYPTSSAIQIALGRGQYQSGFLTRFNPTLTGAIFSTYVGGNDGPTVVDGVSVDAQGNAYVFGFTHAAEFPLTTGHRFDTCVNPEPCETAFAVKLRATGAFGYANQIRFAGPDSFTPIHFSAVAIRSSLLSADVTPNGEGTLALPVQSQGFPAVRSVQPGLGDGPLLESLDGFRTFMNRGAGLTCNDAYWLGFSPADPNYVYSSGDGLCRSTDGGRTWQLVSSASFGQAAFSVYPGLALSPADPLTLLATSTAGVYRSVDGGVTWVSSGSGLPAGLALNIAFDPHDATVAYTSGFYPAGQGGIYRSNDGGATWQQLPATVTGNLQFDRVVATTPTTIFAIGWKSTDGGASWQPSSNRRQYDAPFYITSDPNNPSIAYAAGPPPNGGVCRSADAGETWGACSSTGLIGERGNVVQSLAVDPFSPSTIYGAFGGGISVSRDSGVTWTRTSLRTNYRGGHVAADPARSGRVLLQWRTDGDVGLMTFTADGAALRFSSYLGGRGGERARQVRVDGSGNIYVLGETHSHDFPLNAPRRAAVTSGSDDPLDGFLTKISTSVTTRVDFDADGRTDPSVFRPSTGEWLRAHSRTNTTETTTLGQNGDVPAAADFDGDGQADLAVFRPSIGTWFIRDSSTLTERSVIWGGTATDVPAPADYDGDGKADIAFFRPINGYWYIRQSSTNTPRYVQWGGTPSDVPAPGDYDGDGRADIAFFRPSNGYWYLNRSRAGVQYVQWGGTTADIPTPGDYDGDGRTDVAFWRPSDNYWYIRVSTTGGNRYVRWGGFASDVPVPGDYDQDGLTDQAFFRPGDGYWYVLQSRTRTARYVKLGTAGDIPIPSRR